MQTQVNGEGPKFDQDDLGESREPGLKPVASSEKIKITCHECGARYHVRSSKIRGRRFRAACKKCGGTIVAHCSKSFKVTIESGVKKENFAGLHLDTNDLHRDENEQWFVVLDGQPHGPITPAQIRERYAQGQINERTYLWREGDDQWRHLEDIPELADLVREDSFSEVPTIAVSHGGPLAQPLQPDVEAFDVKPTAFYHQNQQDPLQDEGDWALQNAYNDPFNYEENPQPQPAPEPVPIPVIPPRKAILPAPTGTGQRFTTGRAAVNEKGALLNVEKAPLDAKKHVPPDGNKDKKEVTPSVLSLTALANPHALSIPPPPRTGPGVPSKSAPVPAGKPVAPPPVKSVFDDRLKPVGPPAVVSPHLLKPQPVEFWTRKRIIALVSGAGGVVIVFAVMALYLLSPSATETQNPATPPVAKNIQPQAPSVEQNSLKERGEEVSPAPQDDESKKAPARKPANEPAIPITVHSEKKKGKSKKVARKPVVHKALARRAPSKVARKSTHSRQPAEKKSPQRDSVSSEVDELLSEAEGKRSKTAKADALINSSKSKAGATVDPDDILSAAGSRKSKKSSTADPDAILAGAGDSKGSGGGGLPRKPSKVAIRKAMARVMPMIRSCYDKYGKNGLVKVKITIKPSGSADAVVVGNFNGTPTGFCVLGGVYKAVFPKFSGPAISFVYPIQLQ